MAQSHFISIIKSIFVILTALLTLATIFATYYGDALPSQSYWESLFGMVLPLLLVACLAAALVWLFIDKRISLLALAGFIGSWPYLTTVFQFGSGLDEEELAEKKDKMLTIATFNVAKFGHELTGYSCREIGRLMAEQQVDVLCFQECGDNHAFTHDSIDAALSHWPYHYRPDKETLDKKLAMSIYSRYPMSNSRYIEFEGTANGALASDITYDNKTIRLFNCHLQTTNVSQKRSTWQRELASNDTRREAKMVEDAAETLYRNFVRREQQTQLILEEIENSPHPVILCGDLNSIPSSYTYSALADKLEDGFRTAGHGYMYSYRYGKRLIRIDYIFHDPGLKAIDYFSPDWELCSDHNPVILRIAK